MDRHGDKTEAGRGEENWRSGFEKVGSLRNVLTSSFGTAGTWPVLPASKQREDKSRQVDTKPAVQGRCFGISDSSTCRFTGRTQTEHTYNKLGVISG